MIRIAFVVHGMQPGGIERSVTRIINGLDRNHFDPIVVCLDRSGPAAHWLEDDVPVIEIEKRPGNDFSAVGRLGSVLKAHQVNLVQSHNWGTLLETIVARKLARVPKHIHAERGTVLGTIDSGGWKNRFRAVAMRAALSSVDCVLSNSHAVAKRVEDRCGYPSSRISIIPNGVSGYSTEGRDEARRKVRESLGIAKETTLLGSVGRLHEVKGFDILIRALALVCSGPNSVHLVIVGEGEQRESLERLSKEENIRDRIHLVGHHDNVAPWLLAMDGYVNSSRSEGMSQSMVEAMSTGLPIVATDVGDARRLIRHAGYFCGELCPADNVASLAQSINRLFADEKMFREYSIAAVQCHRKFYCESKFNTSMQVHYFQTIGLTNLSGDPFGNRADSFDETSPESRIVQAGNSTLIEEVTPKPMGGRTGSSK